MRDYTGWDNEPSFRDAQDAHEWRLPMEIDNLAEFCLSLPGKPTRVGVIRQAVRELIERTLATDAETRQRFYAIKRQSEQASTRGLRVVK